MAYNPVKLMAVDGEPCCFIPDNSAEYEFFNRENIKKYSNGSGLRFTMNRDSHFVTQRPAYKTLFIGMTLLTACLWGAGPVLAQESYREWLRKEQESFREFKEQWNKEYADYLAQEWKEFKVFKTGKRDTVSKPVQAPLYDKKHRPFPGVPGKEKAPVRKIESESLSWAVPDVKESKDVLSVLRVTFYGKNFVVSFDPQLASIALKEINEKAISAVWKKFSLLDIDPLIHQLVRSRENMKLNDWGFGMLIYTVAKGVFPRAVNEARLFTWYVLSQAGYRIKVGYTTEKVFLLLPTNQIIFETPFLEQDNRRYQVISFDRENLYPELIYSYERSFPGASRSWDMLIQEMPVLGGTLAKSPVQFEYQGKVFNSYVEHDHDIIRFLQAYPATELDVYFKATLSPHATKSINEFFTPIVKTLGEYDAVALLLRFVQVGFQYQTDEQQFGYERTFFPEEILAYPYADCEDRAIFFAQLVENLLGLDVIGLDYPGHVATAVRFTEKVAGQTIDYQGATYVICDPTFVYSPPGAVIPSKSHLTPKVIVF